MSSPDDHVHGLLQRTQSELDMQRRRNPAIRISRFTGTRGWDPVPVRACPATGPQRPIGRAAKRRSLVPASRALSVLDQPKFQASLPANSAAALRHRILLPFRVTRSSRWPARHQLAQPLKWLDLECFFGPLLAPATSPPDPAPPSHPSRIELPMSWDRHSSALANARSRDGLSFCGPEFSRLLGSSGMANHQVHHRSIEQRPARFGRPVDRLLPSRHPRSVVVASLGGRSGCTSGAL